MSYFKALVSKKKRRFQEEGFDLDLTYIKPNIVAMGFPSEKLEGVYRNHIEEVLRFLEIRHQDHYKIYNLCSERHYDPAKFNNRVATYPFDDHNAPPFELIKPFCEDVEEFLKEDENNVAFIHCKAGKGRTGVMICAYLLHINHFKESKDALKYYGNARTRNAKGVTIPSQRRYVLYYNHLLRHGLQYTRTMVLLKGFEMAPIPSFQNSTCNPFYEVWQQKVKLCQSKIDESKKSIDGFSFDLSLPIPICGDIRVEFFHKDRFKKERMFQFWFNTFFVSQAAVTKEIFEDEPTLKTFELDTDIRYFDVGKPDLDKAHKDLKHKIYASNFKIRVIYSEVGLEASSSASLPRKAKPVMVSKHQKSRSMDSFNDMNSLGQNDDFSDTDNEEEWLKEGKQVVKGRSDTDNEEEWQKEGQQVVKRRSDADIEEEWQKEGQQVVKGRSDTDNEEEWQKEGKQLVVKGSSDTDNEEEWQKEGQQVVKGSADTDNEEEWQKEAQQMVKRRPDTDIEEEWQKEAQQMVKGRSDTDIEEEWQKEAQQMVKRRSDTDIEEKWQKGQQTYV